MDLRRSFSRRQFMGGAATALGYLGLKPGAELLADETVRFPLARRLDAPTSATYIYRIGGAF